MTVAKPAPTSPLLPAARRNFPMHVPLHSGWTVTAVGGEVPEGLAGVRFPAAVPGSVHLDLMTAGVIPDPYLDENELAVGWIGRVDWRYETTFDWDGDGCEVDLVALGLDTVATIDLNGSVIGQTANMHRSYRLRVHDKLRVGPNTLAITFAAGLTAAEASRQTNSLFLPGKWLQPRAAPSAHKPTATVPIFQPMRISPFTFAPTRPNAPLTITAEPALPHPCGRATWLSPMNNICRTETPPLSGSSTRPFTRFMPARIMTPTSTMSSLEVTRTGRPWDTTWRPVWAVRTALT